MLHLHSAWQKITPRTLSKCWYPVLSKNTDEDSIPLSALKKIWKDEEADQVVSETLNLLMEVHQAEYTTNDTTEWNKDDAGINLNDDPNDNAVSEEEDDCQVIEDPKPKIRYSKAIEALKLCM
ncbi:uncharacterized protein LOC126736009 [Anthonomus grandis grandis]|uniref:uncharacterized protein LOC126736009 n=1 Tax=Anthonomus grandis grandis TaxID=2921223 RepID=UPI00216615E4|nr:uncharacterized protein LOC126736009 [Anthonomus grandis grandis]